MEEIVPIIVALISAIASIIKALIDRRSRGKEETANNSILIHQASNISPWLIGIGIYAPVMIFVSLFIKGGWDLAPIAGITVVPLLTLSLAFFRPIKSFTAALITIALLTISFAMEPAAKIFQGTRVSNLFTDSGAVIFIVLVIAVNAMVVSIICYLKSSKYSETRMDKKAIL
jgi:uncharacterized membrane protein YfhO